MGKISERFEMIKISVVFAIQMAIDVHKYLKEESVLNQIA
jgi:hypothetical protein